MPTETARPVAGPGQPRVPLDCLELAGDAAAELALEVNDMGAGFYRGAWWVARLQSGILQCILESGSGSTFSAVATADPPADFPGELFSVEFREVEGGQVGVSCPGADGEPLVLCQLRIIVDGYAVEVLAEPGGEGADLQSESDLLAAAIASELADAGEPLAAWEPEESTRSWPATCASIDLSTGDAVATIPALTGPPGDGGYFADDLRLSLLRAEPDGVGVRCDWSTAGPEYVDARLEILPGGSWALDDAAALPVGSPAPVDGVDEARAFSPEWPGGVVVAAAVGPDLVLAWVLPSDELPTADAQQQAATQLLQDFLATYP